METELDKTATFFRFEDLRIYMKALEYIDWVYKNVNEFPETGRISLAAHFYNSAQAIALHIAEGSARNKPQFIHYLKMAKSSVRECVVHSAMASRQNLFTLKELDDSRNQLMEMTKMLGALIGSLQRSAGIVDSDDD
ncbi:MAG: four helix bundle protein [Bacteroidales bacterium]